MERDNELLLDLYPQDQNELLHLSAVINQLFKKHGALAWNRLDQLILNLIKPIHFSRIINHLPIAQNYHRLSLSPEIYPISVVLFIVNCSEKNGAVALIHTYDNHDPNGTIYNDYAIDNPISPKPGHVLRVIPPHSHKAFCHSIVAWIQNNALITEQFYQLIDRNTLHIEKNEERFLYACGIDQSPGKTIHSLTIDFF